MRQRRRQHVSQRLTAGATLVGGDAKTEDASGALRRLSPIFGVSWWRVGQPQTVTSCSGLAFLLVFRGAFFAERVPKCTYIQKKKCFCRPAFYTAVSLRGPRLSCAKVRLCPKKRKKGCGRRRREAQGPLKGRGVQINDGGGPSGHFR